MKRLVMVLFFCHATCAARHLLKIYFTGSYGLTDNPAFEAVEEVDDIQVAYCNKKIIEAKPDWMLELLNDDPDFFGLLKNSCYFTEPGFFRFIINFLMQNLNQTEGIHILQRIAGCELNKETKEFTGFLKYGYDGVDFIEFDLQGLKWIALRKEALSLKQFWDLDIPKFEYTAFLLKEQCSKWLNDSIVTGYSTLLRTDYPSVSLLQKTPSSPVRCHATGFYPKSFLMFWRKDGEEIHEGVDHGNIIGNQDSTFQYRVDLNVSSFPPEDWVRYDCVFQFTGAEDSIVIKLDKAVIQTNWEESSPISIIIIAVISVVIAIIVIALGLTAYKKRNERPLTPDSENISL